MLTYSPPTVEQYDEFLQMMWEEMQEYLPDAMRILHMTWDEYSQIFRTLGEVRSIYQDEHLAGFYWIEERVDTLHIHGIILKKYISWARDWHHRFDDVDRTFYCQNG